MAASSDGGQAIEVVIEKLQEIVDDIQKNGQDQSFKVREQTEESADTKATPDTNEAIKGERYLEFKNSTHINIVPRSMRESKRHVPNRNESNDGEQQTSTSVVITTVRDKAPSQVVLNFPVDAGEFNISNTEGLIDTLQKLNSVLSKNRESGQKSLFSARNSGKVSAEVQLYKCTKCEYWSHNKYYLKQHVDLVHNAERVYKCPFCDYAGKRSHSLKEHLVVHSNYRPYVCSQCNASFRKKSHLTSHVKLHSQLKGNTNPVCPICMQDGFQNLLALHVHLREVHPNDVYSCDVCQYATSMNKANITMHMLTHGNPKVYTCSDCDFTALHQRIMQEHIAEQHSSEKRDVTEQPTCYEPKPLQIAEVGNQVGSPAIWLKCTDCGFTTVEKEELHDHVIAKHLFVQDATELCSNDDRVDGTAAATGGRKSKEVFGSVAVKKSPMPMSAHAAALKELSNLERAHQHNQTDVTRIRKIVESEPPFKCWSCTFESSVAFEFIAHMIKHLSKPSAAGGRGSKVAGGERQSKLISNVITKQSSVSSQKADAELLAATDSITQKEAYQYDEYNKKEAYQYDEYNKWYQCTLCGYSTEYQRSIKAHIWKHTGHKDLDYPMFQNGPLSMYEATTTAIKSQQEVMSASRSITRQSSWSAKGQSVNTASIKREDTPQTAKPTVSGELSPSRQVKVTDRPGSEANVKVENNCSDSARVSSKKDNYIVLRIPQNRIDASRDLSEQIQEIINDMDVIPNEVVIEDLVEEAASAVQSIGQHSSAEKLSCEGQTAASDKTSNERNATEAGLIQVAQVGSVDVAEVGSVDVAEVGSLEVANARPVDVADARPMEVVDARPIEVANARSVQVASPEPVNVPKPLFKIVSINGNKSNATLVPTAQTLTDKDNVILPPMLPSNTVNETSSSIANVISSTSGTVATLNCAAAAASYTRSITTSDTTNVTSPIASERSSSTTIVTSSIASQGSSNTVIMTSSTAEQTQQSEVLDTPVEGEEVEIVDVETPGSPQAFIPTGLGASAHGTPTKTPDMAAEVSVQSSSMAAPVSGGSSSTSHDSSTDDDSQMSGSYNDSDAEIVTLLTLLKKGPNFNPACPTAFKATAASELAKERLEGLANAVRRRVGDSSVSAASGDVKTAPEFGISSSLLAVIEQLRERTNSTSEDVTATVDDSQMMETRLRKRKRKRTEEDFEKLINIEALEDGGYRCLLCHYMHTNLENLRAHMRLHESRAPHECSLCHFEATCSEDLQEHMMQHCKTRLYQCKLCSANFKYKSQLRAHMCAHKDEVKRLQCVQCDFSTSDSAAFNVHQTVVHGDKKPVYMCKMCECSFQSYPEISQHVLTCQLNKGRDADVDEPQRKQARGGGRLHRCDTCSYVASTQAMLRAHARTHASEVGNLTCGSCGFAARSVRSLKSHMKRHVNDQRFVQQPLEQYKCNLCGYVCHHLPSLKSHMWRHANDANYDYEQINDIINRALEYNDDAPLDGDAAAHASEGSSTHAGKPNYLILFRCCQCGYESVNKPLLNVHMRTHSDIIRKTLEVNENRLVQGKQ